MIRVSVAVIAVLLIVSVAFPQSILQIATENVIVFKDDQPNRSIDNYNYIVIKTSVITSVRGYDNDEAGSRLSESIEITTSELSDDERLANPAFKVYKINVSTDDYKYIMEKLIRVLDQ